MTCPSARQHFAALPLVFVSLIFSLLPAPAFAAYAINIGKAATWLVGVQNADGSWGNVSDAKRFVITAEAIEALQAANIRSAAYYRGLTWLENHAADSADSQARAALVLGLNGDNVEALTTSLQTAQNTAVTGRSGWGAGSAYLQSPMDTALVLRSLSALGSPINTTAAITYLKTAQLSGSGWSLGKETTVDTFSTAWVVRALAPLQASYPSDTALSTAVTTGVNTLKNTVLTSDPVVLQALSAHAALLAGQTATAQTWLASLVNLQATDGSFSSGGNYATALALRAFAAADGLDSAINRTAVSIPDAALRGAINAALGRNAMDNLNRAELAQLTSLTASNLTIGDLTGLQYATNLTYADLRNNAITSTAPLSGLTH